MLSRWASVGALLILAHTAVQTWQVAGSSIPLRYDYDEGVYAQTALQAPRARLYRELFLSQPPLVILALELAYRVAGPTLAAARGTIVVFSSAWLVALVASLAAGGRPRSGLVAAGALATSAPFLVGAHTVQMEVPSEAFGAAAVALAVRARATPGILWWAASGVALGLAVSAKLSGALAAVPLLLLATGEPSPSSRWQAGAGLALGSAVVAAPVLALFGGPDLVHQVIGIHVALLDRAQPPVASHAVTVAGFLARSPALAVGAAAGVARALSGDPLARVFVGWLGADVAWLLILTPLWSHHALLFLSPLALLAGLGVDRLLASPRRSVRRMTAFAVVLAVLADVAASWPALLPATSPELGQMVARVREAVPRARFLLSDDPMVTFLASRQVPPALVDTSEARVRSGDLTDSLLDGALTRRDVDGVVLWRGTFRRLFPLVVQRAHATFPVDVPVGQGELLLRRRSGQCRTYTQLSPISGLLATPWRGGPGPGHP